MIIGRRGFITGLISLAAAPAIVRASSLMPVKQMSPALVSFEQYEKAMNAFLQKRLDEAYAAIRDNMSRCLYGDGTAALLWQHDGPAEALPYVSLLSTVGLYK